MKIDARAVTAMIGDLDSIALFNLLDDRYADELRALVHREYKAGFVTPESIIAAWNELEHD